MIRDFIFDRSSKTRKFKSFVAGYQGYQIQEFVINPYSA